MNGSSSMTITSKWYYFLPLVVVVFMLINLIVMGSWWRHNEWESQASCGVSTLVLLKELEDGWFEDLTELQFSLQEFGHGISGKYAFAAGGYDCNTRYASGIAALLDLKTWKWEVSTINPQIIPPVPVARHHPGGAASNQKLFLIGGFSDNTYAPEKDAYMLDLRKKERKWIRIPDLPIPIGEPTCLTLLLHGKEKIYCIGGYDSELSTRASNVTLSLDPETLKWKTHKGIPHPRGHISAVVLENSKIYAFGGRYPAPGWIPQGKNHSLSMDVSCANVYDAETDTWTDIPPLPLGPRNDAGIAADTESPTKSIFIIGGQAHFLKREFTDVLQYFPHNQSYLCYPPLNDKRKNAVFGAMSFFRDGLLHQISGSSHYGLGCVKKHLVYKPDPSKAFPCDSSRSSYPAVVEANQEYQKKKGVVVPLPCSV